jgi:hypothetical protein
MMIKIILHFDLNQLEYFKSKETNLQIFCRDINISMLQVKGVKTDLPQIFI